MKSFIMALLMSVMMVPVAVSQDDNKEYKVGDYYYRLFIGNEWYCPSDCNSVQLTRSELVEEYPVGDVVVPDCVSIEGVECQVVSVVMTAFNWMSEGQVLKLPSTIRHIERNFEEDEKVFGEDTRRVSVVYPEQIESVGSYGLAFANLDESVSFPSIKTVRYAAFYESGVSNLSFGPNLTMVGTGALSDDGITTLNFEPNASGSISFASFSVGSDMMEELKLPERKVMNLSEQICRRSTSLKRVVFPDVSTINYISLVNSIVGITQYPYGYIFAENPNLSEIVCLGCVPPEFNIPEYFYDYFSKGRLCVADNMEECVLKVPAGCEDAYRSHPIWGHFKAVYGFENGDYTSVDGVGSDDVGNSNNTEYYNLQGIKVSTPVKGQLYIRKTGFDVEKVVL